jgi:hypothetical protein
MAALICQHLGTGTLYNREAGIAFKADCGSRARCPVARRRWRNGMRERMSAVEYFRVPDLWTFTARTAEQDALYLARRMERAGGPVSSASGPKSARPGLDEASVCQRKARNQRARLLVPDVDAILVDGRDRGEATRENIAVLNRGLERVVRRIARQFERQSQPGYMRSRHARRLHARYGTARPVRGRPGAALHIRVREAGELHGRIHAHVASDFDFLLHAWLKDTCLACGLGHPQFERRESREMHAAARFSGPAVRSQTIGLYLSKYLSKSADDAPWPWPAHTRLVSAGLRRKLPARVPKEGWTHRSATVTALIAMEFGEVICDEALQYQEERVVCGHTLRGERCPWPGG